MDLSMFDKFLIILGAVSLSCIICYFIMWLFCVCEGRKW